MADLGLIDSKLGLYIKINVNNGQNKFEVHISKNVAKMAILWPKIGQRHFGARASHGHNLAIFHQILTNEHSKMTNSLRRIEWNTILSSISLFYILVFWPHFCSEASHGQCCTYGLKTTLKLLVHVLAIMASSYLKIVFQQKSGLNPPPPPPPPPPPLKQSNPVSIECFADFPYVSLNTRKYSQKHYQYFFVQFLDKIVIANKCSCIW